MASIQIQATDVIIACNKRIKAYRDESDKQESERKKQEEKVKKLNKPDLFLYLPHVNYFPKEINAVNKILKLAEYAVVATNKEPDKSIVCLGCTGSMEPDGMSDGKQIRYICEDCGGEYVTYIEKKAQPTIIIDQNDFELIGEFL